MDHPRLPSSIMATAQGPLSDLAPEIYSIIASHLPLYATPPTLLALALTNRRISEIVLPLVCSRLILKNKTDAIRVLQKLVDNPSFGRVVRELHIMSERSDDDTCTWRRGPPSDEISRVEDIILMGYLPFIHTLGIYFRCGWYCLGQRCNGRKGFLPQLWEKCPRLRGLILKGFGACCADATWTEDSGVPMNTLALTSSSDMPLLRHVTSLAPSLHTLDLSPGFDTSHLEEGACPLFNIDLPLLRSLTFTFSYGVDTDLAMAFFERHPSLEYLSIALSDIGPHDLWFGSVLPQKFLPNLLHLRANWKNVRLLAPILNQLVSLSIRDSVNAQIPYLFRSILPNGLPNLKSLNIGQISSWSSQSQAAEGNNWYESEDGTFKTNRTPRTVFNDFMHSIVRAVPNLEELGFHYPKKRLLLSSFASIADDLSRLLHLKRLYYAGDIDEDRNEFISEARVLAEAAMGLVSIVNVVKWYSPHPTARIRRRESGEVASIEFEEFKGSVGMEIGYEDNAFPYAPLFFAP